MKDDIELPKTQRVQHLYLFILIVSLQSKIKEP